MKRFALMLIVATLCSFQWGCKKELGEIYGIVMNTKTAEPIIGARVSIYRYNSDEGVGGIFKSMETESDGSFHFTDIETSYKGFMGKESYDFSLEVSATGYKPRSISISVIPNIVNRVDVELEPKR